MQAGGLIDSQLKSTYLADFQAVWFMTCIRKTGRSVKLMGFYTRHFIITGILFL